MKAIDELLYWASINYHPLYERCLREEYEKEHGKHFNEKYAKESVSSMESDGNKGEHWTIEQVKNAISSHKDLLSDEDTCWDAYVALNMWWHDLHDNYSKRGRSDTELIEDALTWSFMDEDAPDGKLWVYINAMK